MQLALEMGALYSGEQLTNTGSFKIEMKIDSIDLDQEIMYGTFQIYNITDKYELLSSFFESIIIGSKHSFNETESDTVHWGMFPEWRSNISNINNSEFIYMKIKELFLLPDPKIKSIPGASIEGFYYCCYYKKLDCFAGHYYFENSTNQVSQQILLERVHQKNSQEAAFV